MKKLFVFTAIVGALLFLAACEGLTTETSTTAAPTSTETSTSSSQTTTTNPTVVSTTATPTTSAAITTTTPTTAVTTAVTTAAPVGEVVPYAAYTVPFINYSTEFIDETPVDSIVFYYYNEKANVPYVDIQEFITMLLGIIDDTVQVEVDLDALTVRVFVSYAVSEEEKAEYGITEDVITEWCLFDFKNETISAKSIDSFDYFSGDTETDFSSGLTLLSYTAEDLPGFSADLGAYGFLLRVLRTTEGEVKFTIPVHLAGLFLTGSMFDVINNGRNLYGLDTYQLGEVDDQSQPLYNTIRLNNDMTTDMREETENYLAFVFDYFYGLKDFKDIPDFRTYMETYFDGVGLFSPELWAFSDSLADLHTGVITTGHTAPTYDYYATHDYPQLIYDYSYNYYGCACDEVKDDFDLQFYGDMAYYRIAEFTVNFKDDIAADMETIRAANPKYVVIDLSCNGGGVLAGVYQLLNYLTNDPISVYTTTLGARSSWTYDVEGDLAIDAEFYIVTSAATFSAANLFTALATESGLAKTIGTQSGGGACSVMALVLPNGAIMQISSQMNLTFSDYYTVEDGVMPDYRINWDTRYLQNKPYYTLAEFYNVIVTYLSTSE